MKDSQGDKESVLHKILSDDKKPFEKLLQLTPSIFLLIILAIIGIDAFKSGGVTLLSQLSNPSAARGLITFLFSIGAVWIAIILVVGAFSEADDKQFNRAKEILIILIGILGTIVGYYFGTEAAGQRNVNFESMLEAQRAAQYFDMKTDRSNTVPGLDSKKVDKSPSTR